MEKTYTPHPLDTSAVELPPKFGELIESLAEHVHDRWAQERIAQGWSYGPSRNDSKKEHPSLRPYGELDETEKRFDRVSAEESLKAIILLGATIAWE